MNRRWIYIWALLVLTFLRGDPIDVSTSPPGGLTPEEVPQLIFITFDDSTTTAMLEGIDRIDDHTNPDGSPIAFTFYVSLDSPDFYNTHVLHAKGHEIAVHTVTHTTGNATSLEDWAREIAACREGLIRYADIPREEIRGFRAPFLAYNKSTFLMLHEMGFAYDTSIPESVNGLNTQGPEAFIWPYHLHDGLKQTPHTGEPPDPDLPLPNLMVVPMWQLQKIGGGEHNMDPDEPSKQAMVDMLKHNFTTRYEGNRVPVAIWNHVGWLNSDDHVDALNEFLTWALAHDDVWVVPVIKVVDWMQNPLPVSDPLHEEILTVHTSTPIPESEVLLNIIGPAYIRSVGNYLPAVPHPSTLLDELLPEDSGVVIEIQVVSDWGTGFQANLVATNPNPTPYTFWQGTIDPAEATLPKPWNVSLNSNADGTLQVLSMGADSTPIEANANQQVLATFWAQGSSDGVRITEGTVLVPKMKIPRLSITAGGKLEWDQLSPIVEVQERNSLQEGDWQTIQTKYGVKETDLPTAAPTSFYRIKAIP